MSTNHPANSWVLYPRTLPSQELVVYATPFPRTAHSSPNLPPGIPHHHWWLTEADAQWAWVELGFPDGEQRLLYYPAARLNAEQAIWLALPKEFREGLQPPSGCAAVIHHQIEISDEMVCEPDGLGMAHSPELIQKVRTTTGWRTTVNLDSFNKEYLLVHYQPSAFGPCEPPAYKFCASLLTL